jgi:hypothetical protein
MRSIVVLFTQTFPVATPISPPGRRAQTAALFVKDLELAFRKQEPERV